MGVPVLRRLRQNARPSWRQRRWRRGDDAGGHACPTWLHDHDRGVPRVLRERRQVSERTMGADPAGAEDPRAQGGQEIRRPEGSAAGQRPLGREVLHARDDGHRPEPGPERRNDQGPRRSDQRRALCPRCEAPLLSTSASSADTVSVSRSSYCSPSCSWSSSRPCRGAACSAWPSACSCSRSPTGGCSSRGRSSCRSASSRSALRTSSRAGSTTSRPSSSRASRPAGVRPRRTSASTTSSRRSSIRTRSSGSA